MRTSQSTNNVVSQPTKKVVTQKVKAVPEAEALQLMWLYYSANKACLAPDIRESREEILSKIMQGLDIETVFAEFVVPLKLQKK